MNNIKFLLKGFEFNFRNPRLDKNGDLLMEYKVVGVSENDKNDGYFYESKFVSSDKVMKFSNVRINGQKVTGVLLPEDKLADMHNILNELLIKRESEIQNIIDELITGKRYIHFNIVGYDFPEYQAWLVNLPDDLQGQEQSLMERAIVTFMGSDERVFNSCDYIKHRVKVRVGRLENSGYILNPEFDSFRQERIGLNKDIVTGFDLPLTYILQPSLDKKLKKEKNIEEIFKKAKETGEKQLLSQWVEACIDDDEPCDIDTVYEYAMPNGFIKIERHHSW